MLYISTDREWVNLNLTKILRNKKNHRGYVGLLEDRCNGRNSGNSIKAQSADSGLPR